MLGGSFCVAVTQTSHCSGTQSSQPTILELYSSVEHCQIFYWEHRNHAVLIMEFHSFPHTHSEHEVNAAATADNTCHLPWLLICCSVFSYKGTCAFSCVVMRNSQEPAIGQAAGTQRQKGVTKGFRLQVNRNYTHTYYQQHFKYNRTWVLKSGIFSFSPLTAALWLSGLTRCIWAYLGSDCPFQRFES